MAMEGVVELDAVILNSMYTNRFVGTATIVRDDEQSPLPTLRAQ